MTNSQQDPDAKYYDERGNLKPEYLPAPDLEVVSEWLFLAEGECHGIATGAPHEEHLLEYQAMARNAYQAIRKARLSLLNPSPPWESR